MDVNFRLRGWRYLGFCTLCILDVTCKLGFAYPKWMLRVGLSLTSAKDMKFESFPRYELFGVTP
jgi:hypothetical protein